MNLKEKIHLISNNKNIDILPLWKVTIWNKKFNSVDKNKQENIIKIKNVSSEKLKSFAVDDGNIKLLSTGNFDGYTKEEIANEYIYEKEVIALPEGGRANIKYWNGKFVNSLNLICISSDKNKYNLKFIFYYLNYKKEFIENNYRGSGVKHPNMSSILDMEIPIPSIEIQNYVVQILDLLTNKLKNIINQINNEIFFRNDQFNIILNKLYSLNYDNNEQLKNIINVSKGKQLNKEKMYKKNDGSKYPVINGGKKPSGFWSEFNCEENIITISQGGESAGFVNWQETKFWAGAHCYIVKLISNKIHYKYIYYFLKNNQSKLMKSKYGAGIPSLNKERILSLNIKLPPLKIQEIIVNRLDMLEYKLNEIYISLNEEIKLRKQQYQYYAKILLHLFKM